MKRKHYLLFALVLLACVSILLWSYRERPLSHLLSGEGTPKYFSNGYYDGMESNTVIVGAVPQESISDLLDAVTVRKGTSYSALPSPCFEITAEYSNHTYRIVVGADKTISIANIEKLASRTFWMDTSGVLFERLYKLHLENGGQAFP